MSIDQKEFAAKIQEEHDHLKDEMKRIRKMTNCEFSDGEFDSWRLDLVWLLRDFHNDLEKHFDLEEEGGFMSDILAIAPQHSHTVEKLESEHQQMLVKLEDAISQLKAIEIKNTEKIEAACQTIHEMLEILTTHEAAEGDLIESTYLNDYGGGD